jgi:hypothetical protein
VKTAMNLEFPQNVGGGFISRVIVTVSRKCLPRGVKNFASKEQKNSVTVDASFMSRTVSLNEKIVITVLY